MEILVKRTASDAESTASFIFIDKQYECMGLEDEHRTKKVWGETRIPAGTYQVELRTEGGFHNRYTQRFGAKHKGMLHIVGVPNFEYVLIHIGNDDDDTAGCLLVGRDLLKHKHFTLSNSTKAYLSLYDKLWRAAEARQLSITFVDDDIDTRGEELAA